MKTKRLLSSAAAVALIAGTTFAAAQGTGTGGATGGGAGGGAGSPPAASSGPSGGGAGGAMNRDQPSSRSGSEMRPDGGAAKQDAAPVCRAQQRDGSSTQRSQDNARDNTNTQDRNQNRAQDSNTTKQLDSTKSAGERDQSRTNTTTTGQAGARANITTEQRTQIRSVIKQQKVQSVNNVNFSVSVGTRVPRGSVTFHRVPQQIVTIYPQWRDYEYFVVKDEIVIIDPQTLEIVAVLEA